LFFQAGKLIQVEDHYRASLNKEYLITRIRHMGGQALPGVSAKGTGEAVDYLNEFDAIPSEIEFRPSLVTPKPKLYGFMSAIVDGALTSDRAQIDEHGRYKLIMPFDVSGSGDGKASRWVRKAEPFGGQGTGMSFPLLKGAEVIWSCMDGDLDRPIITGVVPGTGQGANKSVVTAQNSTDNVIKTPSGIVVQMRDGKGAPPPEDQEGTEQSQTRIQQVSSASTATSSHYMGNNDTTVSLIQQQQHTSSSGVSHNDPINLGFTSADLRDLTSHFSSANLDLNFNLRPLSEPVLQPDSFKILDESGTPGALTDTALSDVGVLTWPTKAGDYIIEVQATFTVFVQASNFNPSIPVYVSTNKEVKKFFKFKVTGLYFTSSADLTAEVGEDYAYQASTFGGTGEINFAPAEGTTLPSGLTLNIKGLLSGKPDTADTYTLTITATDISDTAKTENQTFTITVKENVQFVMTVHKQDNDTTGEDETQKSYSVYLPQYRINKADTPGPQSSYSRIGSYIADEQDLFGDNVYYRTEAGVPLREYVCSSFEEASKGGQNGQHRIIDVLNATKEVYGIDPSFTSSSGFFEYDDPARFGLMEYTDGAKLMIHQNGCFDLAAGTSVTYDSLGESDSLISVVLGENEMVKSERFHKGLTSTGQQWVTQTWENVNSYSYSYGQQHSMFVGMTYDYKCGLSFEAMLGGSVEVSLATKTDFCAGIHAEVKAAASINWSSGPEINLRGSDSINISSGNNEMKGNTVLLQYEPTVITKAATDTTCAAYALAVAGVATAVTAAGVILADTDKGDVKTGALVNQTAAGVVSLAALAVQAAGLMAWRKNSVATKANTAEALPIKLFPFVKVESKKITIEAGAASIVLDGATGAVEIKGTNITMTQETAPGVTGSSLDMSNLGIQMKKGQSRLNINYDAASMQFGPSSSITIDTQGSLLRGPKMGFD
jgi:hypothetical protein